MQLELLKVGTDVLLFLGLVWLGVRFLRSPNTAATRRHIADLEESLKELMREADRAGQSLNEQLVRRQQNLEKLLYDLEAAEQGTSRTLSTVADAQAQLSAQFERARRGIVAEETRPIMSQPEQVKVAPQRARPVFQPPSQEKRVPQAFSQEFSPPPKRHTNIYGEEIVSAPAMSQEIAEYQPTLPQDLRSGGTAYNKATSRYASRLTQNIEKEVVQKTQGMPVPTSRPISPAGPASEKSLNDIYKSAERMLRAGNDLASVANATSLTEDDVALLAQVVQSENRVRPQQTQSMRQTSESFVEAQLERKDSTTHSTVPADGRLGVLSGMKRQVQVL